MPDGLLKRVDAAFRPALFVNHYGSSEICTFTTEPRAAAKPGSAGKAGLNLEVISRWIFEQLSCVAPLIHRVTVRRGICGEGCSYERPSMTPAR
jgi:hypothetical protein